MLCKDWETRLTPMERALELAQQAARRGEVPVGAVVVDPSSGKIVGEGCNAPIASHDPTSHAEIVAIRAAAKAIGNYRLTGFELYVTLEPCAMCAGAMSLARIGKLVFAASDEKGGAVVNGPRFFGQPTCHWRPEIEQDQTLGAQTSALLRAFFAERRK